MAKKKVMKKTDPMETTTTGMKKRKRGCFGCGGAGRMCDSCGEPEGVCDCGDDSLSDHDECLGTGIAFMDLEESDFKGDKGLITKWKEARKEEGLDNA